MEIKQYKEKLRQYIKLINKRKANEIKNAIIEEKPIYQFYIKLEWY